MTLDAIKEALKEVSRWLVLSIVSWLITETVAQLTKVPATVSVHVWVFTYAIPFRLTLQTILTVVGRGIDKALHETGKAVGNTRLMKGITQF